ncbi:type I polyketide synthase [Archangium violaceum]|nr:type I polyketide synthase [Archangium violaceum]
MSETRGDLSQLTPLQRAALAIKELRAKLDEAREAAHTPIAIVGIGCRFPGGPDPRAFWESLRNGVDCSREVPRDRFDIDALYDPDPDALGKVYTRRGYFLDDVRGFDAEFFGVAPREAEAMDPQQRLLLELAWECLEHGGLAPDRIRGSQTGVFVGLMNRDYAELSPTPERIEAHTGAGNAPAVAAGRLAHFLDLRGPALTVDTACSSSLVAIHLAIASLRRREIDLALAGGVNLNLTPWALLTESRARMLAADGRCKTFDASADGFARGEGGGLLALVRLDDALAAGRRIIAVIRGSAVNHDGLSSGLTVPNAEAQARVIRAALADARLPPERVRYVEAHGTGTALGDPIEVDALGRVFATGRGRGDPLLIGSVKTNVGHLESAAGVAGVIKAALSLAHREIPAHLHLHTPNPRIPWTELPIEVVRERRPWPGSEAPPVVGVSSFGAGGTNAHLLLEAAPGETRRAGAGANAGALGQVPIVLAAHDEPALREVAARLRSTPPAADEDATAFADLRATINLGRAKLRQRLAILAEDRRGLEAGLDAFLAGGELPRSIVHGRSGDPGPLAFAFTGQGAQFSGMGRRLYAHQPVFRAALDRCAALLRASGGPPLLALMGLGDAPVASPLSIDRTDHAQIALFCLQHALVELWRSWGIEPDIVLGHSLGELSAALVSGVFTLEEGLRLVLARGRAMQAVDAPGTMIEVRADEAELLPQFAGRGVLAVAAANGPRRVVVSGALAAVESLERELARQGIPAQRLRVSHAFHSPLMEPAVAPFLAVARTVALRAPAIPLISNRSGALEDQAFARPEYWAEHILHPVRFAAGLEAALALGARSFVEVGPRPVLSSLGLLAQGGREGVRFIPTLRGGEDDRSEAFRALAELHVAGVRVDWAALEQGRVHRHLDLPTYPFQRRPYWVRTAVQEPRPAALPNDALLAVRWTETPREASPLRALDGTDRAALGERLTRLVGELGVDGRAIEGLDAMVRAWASRAVAEVGEEGERVEPGMRRPFEVIRGHARHGGASIAEPAALAVTLAEQAPALAPVIELIGRCGPRLPAVLRGELDPTTVLFPNGDLEPAARLYRDTPGARLIHGMLSDLLGRALASTDRPLRILEIGGGTGATTAQLLPLLDARCCRYDFTDLSPRFAGRARERFADYGFVDYRCLDIERDPGAQGFAPASYDLIVAANVVHATTSLDQTLAHVAGLLAPGGQLWLIEATRPESWIDLSFGLTEGWWRFTDERSRPDSPLLATADWARRLSVAGFGAFSCFEPSADMPLLPVQALMVAVKTGQRAQRWHVAAGGEEAAPLAVSLAAELRVREQIVAAHLDEPVEQVVYVAGGSAPARACADVLALLEALRRSPSARLWLITRGATSVGPVVEPLHAALWGMASVIAVEAPEHRCTCIDLGAGAGAANAGGEPGAIERLVGELLDGGDEEQLALRGGKRLRARLEPLHPVPARARPQLDPDARYVVAGGNSGLGLCLVEWMVERGARHVVTLGRRSEAELPQAERQRLSAVRTRGVALDVLAVDVRDREALERGLAPFLADSRHRLAGIAHAVGVLRDRTLARATSEDFEAVLGPKIDGVQNLHSLTAGHALDHFLIFSSGAGLWGPVGQASHAAANAYLDAFAAWRAATGRPTQVIDWGAVRATGAAADEGVLERVRGMGLEALSVAAFDEALDRLWGGSTTQVAVLPRRVGPLPEPWAHRPFLRALAGTTPARNVPAPVHVAPPPREESWRALLGGLPQGRRRSRLRELLAGALVDVLRLHQPPDEAEGFFDLGMDSLTAVEFRNRLQRELELSLSVNLLFDHPNLRKLTEYLDGSLLDPGAGRTSGSALAAAAAPARETDDAVAIVGMACRFPGGAGLREFWSSLREGIDCSGPLPEGRWAFDDIYQAQADVRRGSFLPEVGGFDADFFAISPSEARRMDPQHRLLLELAWEAFEHASIPAPEFDRGGTGVFVGVSGDDYARLISRAGLATIDAMVGTGTSSSAAAGRISHALGLTGPAFAVNTGCSSSLVSVHLARQSLLRGECRAALAGGVSLMLGPDAMVMTSKARMLSADGRCKTFDAAADGYGRGEGGGFVLLKRLSDARADGDRVLAIVRGSAINQDGRTSGLTVPHGPAQQVVIRRALEEAGVHPREIDYVEAHGTGTPLGDPIEVGALQAVFGPERTRPLAIGTVKTNIGHLEAAAGIAGLIKTALAMVHHELPPHLHLRRPNPRIDWQAAPIEVVQQLRAWQGARRFAGVSSFGFTGTNAHVVLASGDESTPSTHAEPTREPVARSGSGLLCIAAKAPAALDALEASYRQRLADADVPALCAAAHLGRTHFRAERLALLIDGGAVVERLRRPADAPAPEPRVCLLFGAHGEPDARLSGDPHLSACFDAWRRVAATLGTSLAPGGPLWALACAEALGEHWRGLGIELDVVAGVGIGRLGAAVVAGKLDRVVAARQALVGDAPAASALTADGALAFSEVEAILAEPPDRRPSHVLCLGQGFGDAAERLAAAGVRVLTPRADERFDRRILARLYVDGASIDWRHVHGERRVGDLHLSSYPWQRERYWFDDEPERGLRLEALPRMPGTDALRLEATISARSPAWLAEHALHLGGRRTPVFPAAAFLALAVESARHLLGQQPFELAELRFERPLMIEGAARHRLQVVCSPPVNSEGEITIYSTPAEGEPNWVRHMRAALRRCGEASAQARPVEPPTGDTLSLEAHYAAGEARGVVLGPSFRGLTWVALADGEVRAAASLPPTLEPGAWLHPALLDSCFQGAGAPLYAEGLQGTWVPAGVERIRPSLPGERVVSARLRCSWRPRTGDALVGDLEILDEAGRIVAELEGLRFERIDARGDAWRPWLVRMDWQPQPPPAARSLLPSLDVLERAVQRSLERRWEAARSGGYGEALAALESRAREHVQRAFAVLDRGAIAPRHARLLARLDAFAAEPPGVPFEPTAAQRAASELALLDRCGDRLAEVLRGAVDPLQLLFPDGDSSAVARLYTESAAAVTMNGALRDLVDAVVRSHPARRLFRVLEIGAGTGGTTAGLLDRFDPETTRYLFTDVSAHLLARAAERFSSHRFVEYARFDAEVDPGQQGLEAGGFDLVIAANVLHATRRLGETLANARRLLAPGGMLLVLETTRAQAWTDLTFGLTDGWWRFEADGCRERHPLVDAPTWRRALLDAGFSEARSFAPPDDPAAVSHMAIIAGRAPEREAARVPRRRLILSDRGGLGETLAAMLRAAGDEVECLPASRRGELDEQMAARFDDLVHLWGLDVEEGLDGVAAARAAIEGGVFSALAGLRPRMGSQDATVLLVTRAAVFDEVGVTEARPSLLGGASGCFQAPLWGLGRVASLELTGVRVVCLDLDPCPDPADAAYLCEELNARGSKEDRVILRAGQRLVARLVPDTLGEVPPVSARDDDGEARAWLRGEHGSLDELRFAPVPRRPPGVGEVEVRVRAAGLNFKDLLMALGAVRGGAEGGAEPRRMGLECAGEIVALGDGVEHLRVGERVAVMAPGSLATHVTVAATAVVPIPGLPALSAAALPSAFMTALHGLSELAGLRRGERVLIHAAAGGVGLAAVCIARELGAEIWATASPRKWPLLRRLGVHHLMSSRTLDFADTVLAETGGRGVDVVLNSLTGDGFVAASLSACAPGGRFVELAQRGAWTAARIAEVRPDVRYHHFDLQAELGHEPDGGRARLQAALAQGARTGMPVVTRFALSDVPAALAFMQRARHVGKIVVEESRRSSARVRDDGTYVITGGLSGLGLHHARWLVARGARHLALISRRGLPEDARSEARVAVEAMRAAGAQVLTPRADVSDREQLAAALAQVHASCPPIVGVVHSAGQLADASLASLDEQTAWRVLAAKVLGAWNLHCLTRDLDSFVLFSAAASIIGNKGQANHAAANAFLDALAAWRRRTGLPALVINWGAVAEIGSAAGPEVQTRLRGMGMAPIPADAVSTLVEVGLACERTQMIVLPPAPGGYAFADEPFFSALRPTESGARAAGTSAPAAGTAGAPPTPPATGPRGGESLVARIAAASTTQARQELVAARVREHVAALLGFPSPSRVGLRRPFFELGLDSLTALELRNRIVAELPCRLDPTFAFALPTVEELSGVLVEQLEAREHTPPVTAAGEASPESLPSSLSTEELAGLLAEELAAIAEEESQS